MRILLLLPFLFAFLILHAQQDTSYSRFGNGLRVVAKDSTFSAKFSFRMQFNYAGELESSEQDEVSNTYTDRMRIRRSRLKADGFVYKEEVEYKFEYDLVNAIVLDAAIKWNFTGEWQLWVGQTKLPSNRERIISSQQLQFVDRSLLNARYTVDRDRGIQLRNKQGFGKVVVREALAFSQGEGIFNSLTSSGYDYTARLEVLPNGTFKGKGDYSGSDLVREQTLKSSIAVTYDLNTSAQLSDGQLGEVVGVFSDLQGVYVDAMVKYRGFSFMGEFAHRSVVRGELGLIDTLGNYLTSYRVGQAYNLQAGILLPSDLEFAFRYTHDSPEKGTRVPEQDQYTLGVSRYFVGHALKVQSDITLITVAGAGEMLQFRLQTELAF